MKKLWLLLVLGIVSSALVLRHHAHKKEFIHFVEDEIYDPTDKNFGAFPPDMPEKLFDNFSV